MSARNILMAAAAGSADDKLYVDDVFSAYTYTGNGSTQTINTGIDLAGKGGLVWIKSRSDTVPHYLQDSARGNFGQSLQSQATDAQFATSYISEVTNTRYSVFGNTNLSGQATVAWTFRKAPKFFDIVVGTGSGTFNHSLGVTPGMIILKSTSISDNWYVVHRGLTGDISGTYNVLLNSLREEANSYVSFSPTDAQFSISSSYVSSGNSWVAYLFAHDPSTDGIIQCGSFTGDSSGNASVDLGWEPQYILAKSKATGSWFSLDTSRGINTGGQDPYLFINSSNGEAATDLASVNSTGFTTNQGAFASQTYIYLAIRRPNKPPTSGEQVYNAMLRTSTSNGGVVTLTCGFPPDLHVIKTRSAWGASFLTDRLRGRGAGYLNSTGANQETAPGGLASVNSFLQNGVSLSEPPTGNAYVNHFFRRAPGFFDVVCYTGTGTANSVRHGLGVAPELVILKARGTESGGNAGGWFVSAPSILGNSVCLLNYPDQASGYGGCAVPVTTTTFTNGSLGFGHQSGVNYVAYLFSSKSGVSKVGSYAGNGTHQTINCGFTTGARFILIKRTDSNGDWYIWDSARGIVSANDPHLSLNTTAAEVTGNDSVDPDSSGFIVNQVAGTNINMSGGTYMFLAIA